MKSLLTVIHNFDIRPAIEQEGYWTPSLHYHDAYEIYFVEEDGREMILDDKIYTLNKYDVAIIPPFALHKLGGEFKGRNIIHLNKKALLKYYTEEAVDKMFVFSEPEIITISKEEHDRIVDIMNQYYNMVRNEQGNFFVYLGDILAILSNAPSKRKRSAERSASINGNVLGIMEYMNNQFGNIESIEQIASHFYITKYYLCRVFREYTGITVMEYLNNVRISKACSMLIATNESITDICFMCGFNSTMYFSRLFRNYTGYSPSEYRKHAKKNMLY